MTSAPGSGGKEPSRDASGHFECTPSRGNLGWARSWWALDHRREGFTCEPVRPFAATCGWVSSLHPPTRPHTTLLPPKP